MRKYGVETIIICDAKSASEDLLALADSYKDFRDILHAGGDDGPGEGCADDRDERDGRPTVGMSFADALNAMIAYSDNKAYNIGKLPTSSTGQTVKELEVDWTDI